jgi:hypothetical protein
VYKRLAPSRQISIILLLFLMLIGATLLWGQSRTEEHAYDLNGQGSRGLLLLRRWLQEMGYRVETTSGMTFNLPPEPGLFFVYPGAEPFSEDDAARLAAWVEAGGTLAIIGWGDWELSNAFEYELVSPTLGTMGSSARQPQPILPEAPAGFWGPGPVSLPQPDGADAVPVLVAANDQPAVWVQQWGDGTLWLFPMRYDFTNAELSAPYQPHLLLALLRTVEDGGTVTFDTYHLYGPSALADGRVLSIRDWLYGTTTGWATLFLFLLGICYLLLQGRRLGPPLVIPAQNRRREAAEFVVAMAGLQRRARVTDSIARHHRQRLLLALGRPHRIPSDLGDAEFLERLRRADSSMNDQRLAAIGALLRDLSALPDEEALVQLAAEVDKFTTRKEVT